MARWIGTALAAVIGMAGGMTGACGTSGDFGQLQCWGGAYFINGGCFCPLGMPWDGGACQGQAQAGTCGGGAFQVDTQCFCAVGTRWDGASCAEIVCTGGAYLDGNDCRCPAGKQWLDSQCQVPCVPGAYHVDANTCACPDGMLSYGDQIGCHVPCEGGSRPNGSGCACDYGTVWDGGACVTPVAQPAPQPYPQPGPGPEPYPQPGPYPQPQPGPQPYPQPGPSPGPTPVIERWEMPKYPSPPFVAHYGKRCKEFLQTPDNKGECMRFCTATIQTGVSQGCTCMDMMQHCDGTKDKPVRVQ